MKTKTIASIGIAAALVAAAFYHVSMRENQTATSAGAPVESNPFPFVKSFGGTGSDGDLKVGANDALVVDIALRNLFEYYLAAVGEKSIVDIRAETERELDRKLKPVAATQAKRLLGRYLDYKRALFDIEKNAQLAGNASSAMHARIAAMQQVRAKYFSATENKGLFGFDDAYDQDALARLDVSLDAHLTAEQKAAKLKALDAALPPAVRDAREAPMVVVRLEESVAKMRAAGASDDEVYRMRAATISPEAAARLSDLDRDEAAWKNRINDYLGERRQLIAVNAAQSEADRETALQQLRQSKFSSDEQKRLPAYE